ncbi:MAG: hypothetical protein K8W52_13540 [Deltaproteobacteria bacterium]|nr:hypothetical protein [Deltaproteobacteria bacterium]
MKLALVSVLALAACGKSAAAPPTAPEIKTKPTTLTLGGGGYYQVSGVMPDWAHGDNRNGRGDDQLYVELHGDIVASFRVRPWSRYASDGEPRAVVAGAAEGFQRIRDHDDGTTSAAGKQVPLEDVTPIGDHAWSYAVQWSTTTDEAIAGRVHVAQPDAHDPSQPMMGFTCEIVVHRRDAGLKSEVDYRATWKPLAELCAHLTMGRVKA